MCSPPCSHVQVSAPVSSAQCGLPDPVWPSLTTVSYTGLSLVNHTIPVVVSSKHISLPEVNVCVNYLPAFCPAPHHHTVHENWYLHCLVDVFLTLGGVPGTK